MNSADRESIHKEESGLAYEYIPAASFSKRSIRQLCEDYFNQEADQYDAHDSSALRRSMYLSAIDSYVLDQAQRLASCRQILSFGCGTGRREESLATGLPHQVEITGVEISERMAKMARARGLRVIRALGDPGTPDSNSVDLAIALYSFIHCPNRSSRLSTLRAMRKSLKPGGLLIVDVFNLDDKFEFDSKIADGGIAIPPLRRGSAKGDTYYRRREGDAVSFMHYFTVGEMASILEESGLTIQGVTGVGHGYLPGRLGVPLDEGCLLFTCTKVR